MGILIIKLRKRIMPPPSVIGIVVGPFIRILVMEQKPVVIRAVRRDIGALLVILRFLIDPFPIQPLIKRTAVIEHTVYNDTDVPLMRFLHKPGKKLIACL